MSIDNAERNVTINHYLGVFAPDPEIVSLMTPSDIIARGARHFVVVACDGPTCAAVPIASGYHRQVRGDVRLSPGVGGLAAPVARCAPMLVADGEVVGRVSGADLARIVAGVRTVAEAVATERKYGADRAFARIAAAEVSAVR